jgi:hypothetical protein
MSLIGRIRLFPADAVPAPRPAAVPVVDDGAELGEDELEAVVGGLERIYVPDPAGY